MLSAIRAFAKSWVAAVLIGLLIISFAVFGTRDMFKSAVSKDSVVQAGSRSLAAADFKRAFDNYLKDAQQRTGQTVTADAAVENGLDRQLLDEMAAAESFAELLRRAGVQPSAKLVVSELRKNPGLFDPVTGRFDETIYKQKLAENGLTPARFEAYLRDDLAQNHLIASVINGLQAPRAYAALGAAYLSEQRDVAYFAVDPTAADQPGAPTDAQLQAFVNENRAQLTVPETRVITLVRFSSAALAPSLPVDPAELQRRFAFRKDSLSQAETRTVVQVPAKDAATAAVVQRRLAAGEAPAAVAKSIGVEAITYDAKPRSAITDPAIANAAFGLPQGAVSPPIQGGLGFAVVKVLSITPGTSVTLDQVRPQIEAEVRADAAQEKVYDLTQAYDDAHASGANLVAAATKVGAPTMSVGPISAQGVDAQGQRSPLLTPKLVKIAFETPAGSDSEIQDDGKGEYFAVRVEKVNPAAVPPLNEIKPQLVRIWTLREAAKHMQARADALSARITKGETLEAVAASVGAKLTNVVGLDRASASQSTALSRDGLGKAFSAKPGEVFTAQNTRFGLIVGRLQAVRGGSPYQMAQIAESQRQQLTVDLFRGIGESARRAARTELKTKVDLKQARRAIGVDPDTVSGNATAKDGAEPKS